MHKKWIALLGLEFLLAGCQTLPHICSPEVASDIGFTSAMQGKSSEVAVPAACVDTFAEGYRSGYARGYSRGLSKRCEATAFEDRGREDGERGESDKFDLAAFKSCPNPAAIETFYRRGYKSGLAEFCSRNGAYQNGFTTGEKGRRSEFPDDSYAVCGGDNKARLMAQFQKGLQDGLARYCSGENVTDEARRDGELGKPKQLLEERFGNCPEEVRKNTKSLYDAGYREGVMRLCTSTKLLSMAKEQAHSASTPTIPESLSLCGADSVGVFHQEFQDERKKIVSAQCTTQNGQAQGKKDALSSNEKKLELPVFCDTDSFADYMTGYQDGWKEAKDKLCDPTASFDKGLEDARQGVAPRFTLPMDCPTEYQPKLYGNYRDGYYSWFNSQAEKDAVNYSPLIAEESCLRKGYPASRCRGVTCLACIETGHPPDSCKIESAYMIAVDACLRKGFNPFQCRNVKDKKCIEAGKSPFQCERAPGNNT